MAGCYHDKQDFKSDLNIEVAKEGDILETGQDLHDIKCDKNPGHTGFIPFKDLTLEHLPNKHRNTEILDRIKKMGSVVVRLVVDKNDNGRWIKELGSGQVVKLNNKYFIQTNNHVVKTEDEVKHCTVEFDYDDDDRSNVLTSRGVKLVWTCPFRDFTLFTFHPIPDFLFQHGLMEDRCLWSRVVVMYKSNQIDFVETFHVIRSCISKLPFYSRLNLNSSLIVLMFISCHEGYISYIKSCYFKFEPIPSNIHQLTSIAIHIDEDDGNSRVITGDVVKFGHEFVVKISETIFQDEVKKCRLVWNGDVIGRGTRLYFQREKASEVLSGVDLEQHIGHGIDNFWLFDYHPIPRHVETVLHKQRSTIFCCIGHPHGGIKMVTFGRELGLSLERFDNRGRHIAQPNQDCQCKAVACMKYSCKTCPGSSGSPVFVLKKGMDSNNDVVHFMGKNVGEILLNGELIENVNTAWCLTGF